MTRKERNLYLWEQIHKIMNGVVYKKCSICSEWKIENIEYYYLKNKSFPEKGFQSECKECSRIKANERNAKNPEAHRLATQKWYDNNSEYKRTYVSNWYQDNKDYKREYYNTYFKNNPDKVLIYGKKRRQHKKHEITDSEWMNCKVYFDCCCAYCGLPIEEHIIKYRGKIIKGDFHKEHVIYCGKNDLSNCIPSCESCNSQKNLKTLNEWYNINNPKYDRNRYLKIYYWLRYDYKKYIMPKRRFKGQRYTQRLKEIENNKNQILDNYFNNMVQ